jgi:mannosyltransferase OCH1-like enzyme
MYMHLFGGIYADLDLVPLSPVHQHLPILSARSPPPIHFAYVGHMSGNDFEHSIPNAFMASIPAGHPFWLKPLHFIQENLNSKTHNYPEALTGPVALKSCVNTWEVEREARLADGVFDELTVLENGKVRSLKFTSHSTKS